MKEKSRLGPAPGDAARTSVISARARPLFSLRLHSLHSSGRYSLWLQAGGREGGRQEQDTSLSLSLSHWFSKLGFKAPTKLSLRHSKARLAQQLCQFEKKWRRVRRSRELHSILSRFLSRNFGSSHHFGVCGVLGGGRAPEPSLKKWNINSELCLASNTVHFPRHWQLVWAFKV